MKTEASFMEKLIFFYLMWTWTLLYIFTYPFTEAAWFPAANGFGWSVIVYWLISGLYISVRNDQMKKERKQKEKQERRAKQDEGLEVN